MKNKSGIYSIKNNLNGKLYIGSAACIKSRFNTHKHLLNNGKHHSIKLQRSWNKNGSKSFSFEVILLCSKDNLLFYEQLLIDKLFTVDSGYNVSRIAGSRLGVLANNDTKRKISSALIGNSYRKGIPHSEESKLKMKLSSPRRRLSENDIKRISDMHKGKIVSESTREIMSLNRMGRIQNNSRSKISGVYWNSRKNKWKAVIRINKEIKFIGYFESVELASLSIEKIRKNNEMY